MPPDNIGKTTEQHQDYLIGGEGIRPNRVITITQDQANRLMGNPEQKPAPALVRAFEQRHQNQLLSKNHK